MSHETMKPIVFLSFAARDQALADKVSGALKANEIETVSSQNVPAGSDVTAWVRKAMGRSDALVAVVSSEHADSPWVAFDVGAASAWGKPMLVVRTGTSPLPAYLWKLRAFDGDHLEPLVHALRREAEPLTEPEVKVLRDVYAECGIPSDRLRNDPDATNHLVEAFNRRARSTSGSGRLVRELARLSKLGKLPRLRRDSGNAAPAHRLRA